MIHHYIHSPGCSENHFCENPVFFVALAERPKEVPDGAYKKRILQKY
jgi:hypothetical protein